MQVEGDAKMLKKTTEQLAERTEALKQELATQKEDFSQRLFEAQQENNQVRAIVVLQQFALIPAGVVTWDIHAAVPAKSSTHVEKTCWLRSSCLAGQEPG